jgi:hypothetical protein
MEGSGWLWIVVDVIFVLVLGAVIAWGGLLRRRRGGDTAVSLEALKPGEEARRTGRYSRWQDWGLLALGVWLCASPWLGVSSVPVSAVINAIVIGALLVLIALAAIYRFEAPQEWAMLVIAAWLFASPWLLGFAGANDTA